MEKWEQELWDQLEVLAIEDKIIQSGELIVYVNGELLPKLGAFRRLQTRKAVKQEGMSIGLLADKIGARASTVRRLMTEAQQGNDS